MQHIHELKILNGALIVEHTDIMYGFVYLRANPISIKFSIIGTKRMLNLKTFFDHRGRSRLNSIIFISG